MSAYRNYTTWNKNNLNSTYDGSSSSKPEANSSKYEAGYSRSGTTDVKKINDAGTSTNLRTGQKYGSYSSGYQREDSTIRDTGKYAGSTNLPTRIKETSAKKETSHPPISYRPVSRTGGSRSRDPSAERDTYNKLCPSSYSTRSSSREKTESSSSTSTIPKYTGRLSVPKDDKYSLGRTSTNASREDLSSLSKYKTAASSRASSREDLDTLPKKYITSRFLPKNTIEKSNTAYSRLSSTRITSSQRETSRKNREILNLLSAHSETTKTNSKPVSRASSSLSEDASKEKTSLTEPLALSNQTTLIKAKANTSRLPEKQTVESKKLDNKEDLSRSNKVGNKSATPWSNYLDLTFSSPDNETKSAKTCSDSSQVEFSKQSSYSNNFSTSPKSTSKTNSSKSMNQNIKSKSSQSIPKQLPPQVPGFMVPNKDFRKSVLNMSPENKNKKSQRSSSVSSAESEIEIPLSEATDVSENLSSCKSFHKTSSSSISKLPKRSNGEATESHSRRSTTRSPSIPSENNSNSNAPTSGSDDDSKSKSTRSKSDNKQKKKDESVLDKSPKPPINPRPKNDNPKSENEPKSFLMKALSPMGSLFKVKHDSSDKTNWMDSSSEYISESSKSDNKAKGLHTEAEEKTWWFEEKSLDGPKKTIRKIESENLNGLGQKKSLRRAESGERPWWLDENAQVPEGIIIYATEDEINSLRNSPKRCEEQKKILCRVESGEKPWWLDENGEIPEGIHVYSVVNKPVEDNIMTKEYTEKHKIRHIDSGERAWWLCSNENIPEMINKSDARAGYKISHQRSGEKAWWLGNPKHESNDTSDSDSDNENQLILGDRASPEGLEMPKPDVEGRLHPYDNVPRMKQKRPDSLFISRHKNIDDILGGASQCLSPLMDRILDYQENTFLDNECREVNPDQVKIHDSTAQRGIIQPNRVDVIGGYSNNSCNKKLDDASLQLYKDGDYGSYLDLEASISEQQEEFEGFQSNKKNSIVLRTQLSVRVHTIIEKLLTSEGRELRRALFSLKQIFQEDKDLVHEFVQNDGLACLIKVGSEADQNYQNYILRALGQVMLYVDGMNGVIQHNETVQWLYSLISSKFRLVVKTALKLLLVFVEYIDSNCLLLIKAVHVVDCSQGLLPWYNVMKLLKDFDSADTELLIYAMTLINKCFNGIPDQDTYYDQADSLEEQGIEGIIQRYMSKPGTDLDLLQQFQIYEAVLQYEDSEEKGIPLRHLDESVRKTLRSRKSVVVSSERRKSRRHSTGTSPFNSSLNMRKNLDLLANIEGDESSSSQSSACPNDVHLNGSYKENNKASEAGVTPALRRRRERAERQRSFMREQQETAALFRESSGQSEENSEKTNGNYNNALQQRIPNGNILHRTSSRKDLTPLLNAVNKLESEENGLTKQPWILSMMYSGKTIDDQNHESLEDTNENDRRMLMQLKKENTVKDLTQKLANQNVVHGPTEDKTNRIGDMTGLISKAKEGLAKSKSKADVLKSPTSENLPKIEIKKSENELRWEELVNSIDRPLRLCDLDFTDLGSDDETNVLAPVASTNGIPPPPPPLIADMLTPPPPPVHSRIPPPAPNPPIFGINAQRNFKPAESKIPIKKNKKTVKLFWKEVRDDPIIAMKLKTGLIWDELTPVNVDTQKLEHLFESRAKDLITKKQQELNKNKEIIVLDPKRSNAINIGMTKLPPPRSIKTAILKMDATIMNREGIEKLLTMLPTEEERTKIQDAQAANPDLPLGSAEQFLLTLASISELPARLNLWAFKLDFENSEREIAEPLMDLKQGYEVLKVNKTFRCILGTLLSIGIFLNGAEVKGFQIEYLAKVPEVKDTVHKHSLLHHLCHIVMEKFPDSTDLYSEMGAITRASKIDFDELALNIQRLEADCKASWDHLKLIAKHDGSTMMKIKMSDFLADCAERIILLGIIHRRVMNRFHRFLLWLGIPLHQISDTKPNEFCRIVSEFALEYRTTRERVLQQLEKKANHRERNKTRGKMITEIGKFRTKEDRADAELRQLLGSDMSDMESLQGTLTWRRRSRDTNRSFLSQANGNLTDGDDEILESLVKTATKGPSRTAPRERKRTRHADRKSLRRTLKNGLTEEEKKHLSAYIKSY